MRAIEAAAIASGKVTGLALMERAGAGVVEAVFAAWPELAAAKRRAAVLCGPGNNGGDGFVVARLLREAGWEVQVFLPGDPARLPADARANYECWCGMGEVRALPGPEEGYDPWGVDLVIDALFGIGLSRPLEDVAGLARLLPEREARGESGCPRVVAVDVPSGLCADSGRRLGGRALWADLTVTFHRAKTGHYLAEGPFCCGKLRVVPIGLEGMGEATGLVGAEAAGRLTKADPFGREGHKFVHGHALILSGPAGRGGAARLAARGALRIGAGLVTVGCAPAAMAEHAARLDAVMLREVADAAALAAALEDRRITALCLGPGMGLGAREADLLAAALRGGGAPHPALVLDADALTLVARDQALFAALHAACVLTPHAGEFARLFPDLAGRLAAPAAAGPAFSKLDAARAAAARAGCVVVFKGPDTVIAGPDGRCALHAAQYERAAPWLATAGSGDVLAGFICGLLARGFSPFDAACTAVWLHVEAARAFGPGLIAEDLPETLPQVLRALGL
nr:NAD(P)H-hydrate dehydratase [Pseudotabrizicola algicola]